MPPDHNSHLLPGFLRVCVYHGQNRHIDPSADIVLTTYSIITQAKHKGSKSPLHAIHWYRIVLDEAHAIRNSATKQSQAVCELSAWRRWCVTGTPIQNSASDIGSLFNFLQYQPLCQKSMFNRYIMTPINARQPHGIRNLRAALKPICLRRTKDTISRYLPVRREFIQYLTFSPREEQLYEEHAKKFASLPSKIVEHTAETFRQLLTLRLICNHGYDLLDSSRKEPSFEMCCSQCNSYMADEAAGVIFSSWTRMLDLIKLALDQNNIASCRIEGSMNRMQRNNTIRRFQNNSAITVILASLMAGGVG
ncbi:hypothetical protein K440DRAFT_643082 [Wilcoxina mikolae CBS 423.85]|nr:hypothetical protein K440DRAFT_643082 [Wilcoxina mikolae CBS 423.85]